MASVPQQNNADNSLAVIWIIILLFLVLGVIWFNFKEQIIHGVFWVKLWEIKLIEMVTDRPENIRHYIENASTESITVDRMFYICTAVGSYLRYPVIGILAILGIYLVTRSNDFRFNRTHSMKSLLKVELKNWPQISPPTTANLVKADIDKGVWAMAMTPMQFAKKNGVLKEERRALTEGMLLRQQRTYVVVKKGVASRVFALQLGKPWEGIAKLTIAQKTLFAAFIAKALGNDKASRQLLLQVGESTLTGKLNFSGHEKLLEKYAHEKSVQEIIGRHAYVFTVMASLLEFARTDGVMATADFLWLKPVERNLWYMLNAVGRQAAFPEIAGPFAHWLAEKAMGRKIVVPMVDEAVSALEKAVEEVIYNPDSED